MYTEFVQYSGFPASVTRFVRPDGTAEYRMVKDAVQEKDSDGNDVIHGKEVYFEVAPGTSQPTIEEVESNFGIYWSSGIQWPVPDKPVPTTEERLEQIEADSTIALEGIAELYEMMMSK